MNNGISLISSIVGDIAEVKWKMLHPLLDIQIFVLMGINYINPKPKGKASFRCINSTILIGSKPAMD